jgi:hypothetical protein
LRAFTLAEHFTAFQSSRPRSLRGAAPHGVRAVLHRQEATMARHTSLRTPCFPSARKALLRCSALLLAGGVVLPAFAASSAGCEGGGFTVLDRRGNVEVEIPANAVPASFSVQGKYVQFDVVAATFAVQNYTFLFTPNPLDMTGGRDTPVFASKTPDHGGLTLTSAVDLALDGEVLELQRLGPGLSMKIQAKDCAQGGVFQMEPERGDGKPTVIVHTLANAATTLTPFYFDNPNFRAREGDMVPFKDTMIQVTARINIANDYSPRFVARDSAQAARRLDDPACSNSIDKRNGEKATVLHCGGRSVWEVQSGGRMGFVSGEDAIEVAPPPTLCTHQCQAQNRVRGSLGQAGLPVPGARWFAPEASLPLRPAPRSASAWISLPARCGSSAPARAPAAAPVRRRFRAARDRCRGGRGCRPRSGRPRTCALPRRPPRRAAGRSFDQPRVHRHAGRDGDLLRILQHLLGEAAGLRQDLGAVGVGGVVDELVAGVQQPHAPAGLPGQLQGRGEGLGGRLAAVDGNEDALEHGVLLGVAAPS